MWRGMVTLERGEAFANDPDGDRRDRGRRILVGLTDISTAAAIAVRGFL